ncbi:MAG TPA: hypothetical protein VHE53_00505 [Patescibacteria group bacterium]|nr:hypothetical protein [Patescibacteria group bacterium]
MKQETQISPWIKGLSDEQFHAAFMKAQTLIEKHKENEALKALPRVNLDALKKTLEEKPLIDLANPVTPVIESAMPTPATPGSLQPGEKAKRIQLPTETTPPSEAPTQPKPEERTDTQPRRPFTRRMANFIPGPGTILKVGGAALITAAALSSAGGRNNETPDLGIAPPLPTATESAPTRVPPPFSSVTPPKAVEPGLIPLAPKTETPQIVAPIPDNTPTTTPIAPKPESTPTIPATNTSIPRATETHIPSTTPTPQATETGTPFPTITPRPSETARPTGTATTHPTETNTPFPTATKTEKPKPPTTTPTKTEIPPTPREVWMPRENSTFDDNGLIGFGPSSVKPGIIDLSYKDPTTGEWTVYNNIVPVTLVGPDELGNWSNAEIEQATPIRTVTKDGVNYSYHLRNGSKFSINLKMEPGKKAIDLTIVPSPDSAPVSNFQLGNFWGLKEGVTTAQIGATVITADSKPIPDDDYGKNGEFYGYPLPTGSPIKFSGNGMAQYQMLINNPNDDANASIEVRNTPWEPNQNQLRNIMVPGKPWIEMVATAVKNFKKPFTVRLGLG